MSITSGSTVTVAVVPASHPVPACMTLTSTTPHLSITHNATGIMTVWQALLSSPSLTMPLVLWQYDKHCSAHHHSQCHWYYDSMTSTAQLTITHNATGIMTVWQALLSSPSLTMPLVLWQYDKHCSATITHNAMMTMFTTVCSFSIKNFHFNANDPLYQANTVLL